MLFTVFGGIVDAQVIGPRNPFDGVHPGADKANAVLFPGRVVVPFEVLSVGPHVHEEDGAVQIVSRMLLGDDGFFDGIHAADGRAVGMVTPVHVSGADALEPCDLLGLLVIGHAGQMAHGGTGR